MNKVFLILMTGSLLFVQNIRSKTNSGSCWNDIDFEKTEKMLLESSIKSKIPFYEYYKIKNISEGKIKKEIEKGAFYKDRKKKHYTKKKLFVLFYNNGLKAVFKESNKPNEKASYLDRSITAYNISNFLNLRVVPPTVLRKIDGKWGYVQLFIENIPDTPEYIDHLRSIQKTNLYLFLFLMGEVDPSYNNILISKKCLLPVLVDNDSVSPTVQVQWGGVPFQIYTPINEKYPLIHRKDYTSTPFKKTVTLKNPSFEVLKNTFKGLSPDKMDKLKEHIRKYKKVSFFRYKNSYFVKKPRTIYRHFHPPPSHIQNYSLETIKKIEQIDEANLKKLLAGSLKKDQNFINGVLYRKEIILKEMKKLRNKELLSQ